MFKSTFIEIINKNEKNMIAGCIYKHAKQTIPDFLDNLLPLLEKLSHENKQILIKGNFNINLLNYHNNKNTTNFLDTMFFYSSLPFINTPTRVTGH